MDEMILDLEEVLDRVQDDKELLLELFDLFIMDFGIKRKLLSTAIAQNDYDQIKSIAHSLKGASGNISAKSLRETIIKLEIMAQEENLGKAKEILGEMDQRFQIFLVRMISLKKEFGN